jgi:hypothetical protein
MSKAPSVRLVKPRLTAAQGPEKMFKVSYPSFLVIAVVAFSQLVSCADADGSDPYALWDTYTHVDGVYFFRYLAPPWAFVEVDDNTDSQVIAVAPLPDRIDASIETGALHARFKSVVSLRNHTSATAEASADMEHFLEIALETGKVEPFVSAGGHEGFHLSVRLSDRNLRNVYFDVSESRVVVMQLAGRESIAGADFSLLLKGLEPKGDGD